MKVKQLSLIAVILFIFAFASFVIAEDLPKPPKPILKPGDVKHFIKTFPHLAKDFKQFGVMYETKTGDLTVPEALKANEKFLEILKKHGWDEHFFQKIGVIFLGYSSIVYKNEITKANPKIEKSLKEIESNPHLSEAMKKQLKEQLKATQGVLSGQQDIFKHRINEKDLDLIRPLVSELKKVIDEVKDK